MGLWDDLEQFLESRLEQFLQANPQIQVYVLLEQVRDEETQAQNRLTSFRQEEQDLYQQILDTAQQIQKWAARKQKAQAAGRSDLVQAAQQQEAQLLTQGNQLWSRKNEVLTQIQQHEELLKKLIPRRQELEVRAQAQPAAAPPPPPPPPTQAPPAQALLH
ncbi:TIGR04376 family protein, partial [Candidatus Cyanaurora vandensis]|uniref:TIGR04376 family protein n=2 Tax=Candidatus Cyanaurora vandensis TaxID=2714958 RepID=UPI002580F530